MAPFAALLAALTTSAADAQEKPRSDGKQRYPIRTTPVFPDDVWTFWNSVGLAPQPQAHCVVRFDLTPEGRTTNICANCVGRPDPEPFRRAAVKAVETWLYAPLSEASPDEPRAGLLVQFPFEIDGDVWRTDYAANAACVGA